MPHADPLYQLERVLSCLSSMLYVDFILTMTRNIRVEQYAGGKPKLSDDWCGWRKGFIGSVDVVSKMVCTLD